MKFGIEIRREHTGADVAVAMGQIAAGLPMLSLVILSGWLPLIPEKSALSYLFSLGVCAIPRLAALGLSVLYRHTGGEVLFSMVLTAAALAYGLWMRSLLPSKRGKTARVILAALMAADLVLRLLPLGFAAQFGLAAELPAFALRAAGLVLILLDLRAGKNPKPAGNP